MKKFFLLLLLIIGTQAVSAQDANRDQGKVPQGIVFQAKEPGDDTYHEYFYDIHFKQIILVNDGIPGYKTFELTCGKETFFLIGYTEANEAGIFTAAIVNGVTNETTVVKNISRLSVSPDGLTAAIVRNNGIILLETKSKITTFIGNYEQGTTFVWSPSSRYFSFTLGDQTNTWDLTNYTYQVDDAKIIYQWSVDDQFVSETVDKVVDVRQTDHPYRFPLAKTVKKSVWSNSGNSIAYLVSEDDTEAIVKSNAITGSRTRVFSSKIPIDTFYWFQKGINLMALVQDNGLSLLSPEGELTFVGNYTEVTNVCQF